MGFKLPGNLLVLINLSLSTKIGKIFSSFFAEVVGGGSGKRGKTKDEGPAVNRHRRSSALIPTSSNAKLEKAKRHGSSGCLSKHCSYSSLQLQEVSSPLLSLIKGITIKKIMRVDVGLRSCRVTRGFLSGNGCR